MHDLPTSMLAQQAAFRPRTGEELEAFGKQAASRYQAGAGTLTSSVVETVKKAGLSPEQVRRVVEFANHSAYLTEFNKEGAAHKVVNFQGGPADPAAVLQDLNDGGGGTVFDNGAGDYNMPPPDMGKAAAANFSHLRGMAKFASYVDEGDAQLAAGFGAEGASSELPFAEPLTPALDAHSKLAGAYEGYLAALADEEVRFFDVCDGLVHNVKQAALEGTPLSHIVAAWGQLEGGEGFIKNAFQVLTPELVGRGVFGSREAMAESLSVKTAGVGLVNPRHPLVGCYVDFCQSLTKMASLRALAEECQNGVETLQSFLQETTKAASLAGTLGEAAGYIPKAYGAAKQLTAKAAPHVYSGVREFARSAGASENAAHLTGKALGGAVKYAPQAAALLAAEEAYQHARYSPAFQGASNFALARVPYTNQNMIRQYSLQQGFG